MTKKVDFISWIPSQKMLMWEHMFLFWRLFYMTLKVTKFMLLEAKFTCQYMSPALLKLAVQKLQFWFRPFG